MGSARRFNLIRELGSGAFGTVYLAEMESLGGFRKEVALKLLRAEVGEKSDAGRRLRDEARLLGRLRHRHIVQVDDLIRLSGRWAVVMEHVPGHDLEAVITASERLSTPVPPLAAIEICRAIAQALDSAYNGAGSQGEPMRVVHRDIKPSNVRVTPDGEVKVLDFGIARSEFGEREAKTGRVRYGSVAYMSPERLLGEPETTAGDVYALGCVLYELVLGRPLGRVELAPNRQATQISEARARLVERLGELGSSDIADELSTLLADCLAYEVDERPDAATVAERLRVLARKVHGEELGAYTRRFWPKVRDALGDESRNIEGTLVEELVTGVAGAELVGVLPPGRESTTDVAVLLASARQPTSPTLVADDDALPPVVPTTNLAASPAPTGPAPTGPASTGPASTGPASTGPASTAPIGEVAAAAPSRGPVFAIAAVVAAVVVFLALRAFSPDEPAPLTPPVAPVAAQPAVEPPAAPPVEITEPVVAEAPAVEPTVVAPALTEPATPRPKPPTTTTAPTPVDPPPAPVEPAPPVGPRLRAAKFTISGADMVSASCGDRSASGMGSALVRDFPSGPCQVNASIGGASYRAEVRLDSARGVECALEGATLQCR